MSIKRAITRETRIKQLEAACDSIKNNAADFIGNELFPCDWEISIVIEHHAEPYIRLTRKSLPSEVILMRLDPK